MNGILCPHCGKNVEISHAYEIQYKEKIISEEKAKFDSVLLKVKQEASEISMKKSQEAFALQLKQSNEDSLEKDKRIKELLEKTSLLMDDLRVSKREKDEAKIEMKKQLMEEEEKIRSQAQKKAEEEQHLKIIEKDKQLETALKELEDMKRKLQQGSQQLQGEAFEVEFEETLTKQYPHDKIIPVGKGIKGGDIIQEVWDARGNFVGKILWELKNTKTWTEGWIDKLKGDKRTINAEEAVLISETMPQDTKIAGFRQGIWVTKREFVIPLADTLRASLIQLFYVRNSVQSKDEKMEIVYTYLSGTEFKHRVEAIVEAFSRMQADIEKEKRYFANKWARDEKNIRLVIDNTFGMHGDIKGFMGNALPDIKEIGLIEASTT